ncbi:MAG: hypothetical protein M1818_000549 [Claussenomyces sp. TS43310]|nr:MAG: hypothetical protein M1818_000549 [Claussenomyces sp. TS43310]
MASSTRIDGPTSSRSKAVPNSSASEACLFTLQTIPNKGKGLIASQDISPGTCILSEAPLFTTASLTSRETIERDLGTIVRSLPREGQRAFLSLHNNHPGRDPLSNIVRTNAYPLGPGSSIGAIFPTIARLNHSCRPNAQHAWNPAQQRETVRALRHIPAGAELTLSYSAGGPSDERRRLLKQHFGFDCACDVCTLPPNERRASDARLRRAQQLDAAIGDSKRVMLTPEKALADCRALLQLYRDEGMADTRIPRLYYDAFQICAMHSDQARARVFAHRSREARVLCEGEDSPEATLMMALALKPSSHENFGATAKWKTKVDKEPKDLGADLFEKWLWREK